MASDGGLIDRLRHPRPRGYEKSYPQGYSPHRAYNDALEDVRDLMRSDEGQEAIADVLGISRCSCGRIHQVEDIVRLWTGTRSEVTDGE